MSASERWAAAALVLGLPPDGLGAALTDTTLRFDTGALERPAIERTLEAAAALRPRVVTAESTRAAVLAEGPVSDLLRKLLEGPGMTAIRERLVAVRAALPTGHRLALLVDARTRELRGLPWELLELAPPADRALHGCGVVRFEGSGTPRPGGPTGTGRRRRPGRVQVQAWSPDPDDPECETLVRALRAHVGGCPALAFTELPAQLTGLPEPDAGSGRIVHVVTHGRTYAVDVLVRTGGHDLRRARDIAAWAEPLVDDSLAVVLDTCHGASATAAADESPAYLLASLGGGLCVAPSIQLKQQYLSAFAGGFYTALAAGWSLLSAAREGRRAMQGLPHDVHGRWWRQHFVTSSVAGIEAPGPIDPGRPSWVEPRKSARARVDPLAERALEVMYESAASFPYVGVEHLLQGVLGALPDLSPADPVRALLEGVRDALLEAGGSLDLRWRSPPEDERRSLSPAMVRLAEALGGDATFRMLAWSALRHRAVAWRIPDTDLRCLAPRPRGSEMASTASAIDLPVEKAAPWRPDPVGLDHRYDDLPPSGDLLLEVLNGPEGGRSLAVPPGGVLGRHGAPGLACGLFLEPAPGANTISRAHLRYEGRGTIVVIERGGAPAPTALVRREPGPGRRRIVTNAFPVRPLDVVQVGAVYLGVVRVGE